jgi:mannose-1-phosphate guanylyltransferase
MNIINVILSGGVGSRLWPLSRKSRPKQYIPLFDDNTLFKMTIDRNKSITNQLIVVGNIDNYELSRKDIQAAGITNYIEIIEAVPRNTAASIAFAAFAAQPEDILIITPSDHIITGAEQYKVAIEKAIAFAQNDYIVTFGSIPTRPETGYGYIEYNEASDVLSFKEKPNKDIAQEYIESGRYLWNSGMFCFKAATYLKELQQYNPDIYNSAKKVWKSQTNGLLDEELMKKIPSESIDYAVMEHSKIIKVVPFSFDWSDLGSFESLWEYLGKNDATHNNAKNLVIGSKKHVEFIGLENLVYVETEDAVLIMPKNMSQDVKKVYERLEKENPDLLA